MFINNIINTFNRNEKIFLCGAPRSHKSEIIKAIPDTQILDMRNYRNRNIFDTNQLSIDIKNSKAKHIFIDEWQITPNKIMRDIVNKHDVNIIGHIPHRQFPDWAKGNQLFITPLFDKEDTEFLQQDNSLLEKADHWPGIIKLINRQQDKFQNEMSEFILYCLENDLKYFIEIMQYSLNFFKSNINFKFALDTKIKINKEFNFYELEPKQRELIFCGILWIDYQNSCLRIPLPIQILLRKFFYAQLK